MSKIILTKSKRKGKRFMVQMLDFKGSKSHIHHFGSADGSTFIDHKNIQKQKGWIARHSVSKFWNNIHSPLFYSRMLLWKTDDLKQNISLLSKKLNTTIINRI
jgi:hypothetical protein